MGTAQFLALATLNVNASGKRYNADAKSVDWARRTLSRTASLHGVKSVGTSSVIVVSSNNPSEWIPFPSRPYNGEHNDVDIRDVSARYLETLQAKLVRGRFFTDSDDLTKPKVVIINRALAEHYFPGEDSRETNELGLVELVGIEKLGALKRRKLLNRRRSHNAQSA